jgi:hypothetical protein
MIVDRTNTAGFRAVHIGLAVVSFVFAAATWRISNLIDLRDKPCRSGR